MRFPANEGNQSGSLFGFIDPEGNECDLVCILPGSLEELGNYLGPNDVLLVPDRVWRITHYFAELEGQEFTNATLKGQIIDIAQQDNYFRLDRSGAELKAEAKTSMRREP